MSFLKALGDFGLAGESGAAGADWRPRIGEKEGGSDFGGISEHLACFPKQGWQREPGGALGRTTQLVPLLTQASHYEKGHKYK